MTVCALKVKQSESVKQSQSSTEQTVQRTATRVQDCEINPFRPRAREPQNHTKKELTRQQASHFLQLVPGLPRVVGPGLSSNQVECVVLSIIPCVKNRIFRFPWTEWAGVDGAWQTGRVLTSTVSVRLRFPENSIIDLNHVFLFFGCRASIWQLYGDCKYSNLTLSGTPKSKSKQIGIAPCMSQKGVGSTIEEIAISGCVLGPGCVVWVGSGDTDEVLLHASILLMLYYWNPRHCCTGSTPDDRSWSAQSITVTVDRSIKTPEPGTVKKRDRIISLFAFLSGQTVCLFSVVEVTLLSSLRSAILVQSRVHTVQCVHK